MKNKDYEQSREQIENKKTLDEQGHKLQNSNVKSKVQSKKIVGNIFISIYTYYYDLYIFFIRTQNYRVQNSILIRRIAHVMLRILRRVSK